MASLAFSVRCVWWRTMPSEQRPRWSRAANLNSIPQSAATRLKGSRVSEVSAFSLRKSRFRMRKASSICSLLMFSGPPLCNTCTTTGMICTPLRNCVRGWNACILNCCSRAFISGCSLQASACHSSVPQRCSCCALAALIVAPNRRLRESVRIDLFIGWVLVQWRTASCRPSDIQRSTPRKCRRCQLSAAANPV